MTTRRKRILEDEGTILIQKIVRQHNCIYQEVDLKNDQGNDCYIEFITDEVATSFCVFAQVKSGKSYRDKCGYKIPVDHNHLAYWNNHTNPVAGIVYDEVRQEAFWVNISEYLSQNPFILEQKTHTIRVPLENAFSGFRSFKKHFTEYIQEYKSFENYGRSLDNFAQVDNPQICYDGFKSLYSNHRNRSSAWFYIISNFGKINKTGIHGNILGVLSNYIPSDDILWTINNIGFLEKENIRKDIASYLSNFFGTREVKIALEFMRGVVIRGTFSYRIYKVLDLVEDIHKLLLEVTYTETDPEKRDFEFWLFVHFCQWKSKCFTLREIDRYFEVFPEADDDGMIEVIRKALLNNELVLIG